MKGLLLKNGRVIDPANGIDQVAHVLVVGDTIRYVGNDEEFINNSLEVGNLEFRVIDCEGKCVTPGFIDTHAHFRDPGQTYKEDIMTGAESAASGGYTAVITMANTVPPVDNVDTLRYVLERGEKSCIDLYSAANITLGMKGEVLTDMESLTVSGAKVFTDDGKPLTNSCLIRNAMLKAKELGMVLSFHEEDPSLIEVAGYNQGKVAELLGIKGAPACSEDVMVARDIVLAMDTGCEICIQHISSGKTVDIIREAKAQGAKIIGEVTPHHFSFTEEDLPRLKDEGRLTMGKMNPPLRTEWDRMKILEGLRDGTLDLIATDHAPHSLSEKAGDFAKAPSGIIGLETALSLGIVNLVDRGALTMMELVEKMSLAPARLYKIDGGSLAQGQPANIAVFDPEEVWVADEFHSKSQNSPLLGKKLKGKIHYTIVRGRVVYDRIRKNWQN